MADVISKVVIQAEDQTAGAFSSAERSIGALATKTNQLGSISQVAGSALGALGISFSVAGAVAAVQQIGSALISAEANTAKFKATFTSIAGAESVGREFDFVRRTANQLGLDLDATASSYSRLAAAARGTALEGEATRDIFGAISRAATTLGLSSAEADGALLAVSQMMSKGTVQSEELRGQLGERLPGAFQIAARAMGVSTQELGKMLEAGQVIADDFLPRFARQLDSELGQAAVNSAGTAGREFQRVKNEASELFRVLADSGAANAIGNVFRSISSGIAGISERIRLMKAETGGGSLMGWLRILYDDGRAPAQQRYDAAQTRLNSGNLGMYERSQVALERDQALAELNRLRNLAASATGGSQEGGADDAARLAKFEAEKKRVAELSSWYANFSRELSGQHKDYQENLTKLNQAREVGLLKEEAYTAAVQKLIREQGGVKDALGARKRAEEEAERQAKALNEAYFEALGINRNYAEEVRRLQELHRTKRLTTDEYAAAIKRLAAEQPIVRENTKLEEEAQRAAERADKDRQAVIATLTKSRQEAATSMQKQLEEADKAIQATRDETAQAGLSKDQLAAVTAQRWLDKAAMVEQRIEQNGVVVASSEEYDSLVALANKYRENAAEIRAGARAAAIRDEASASADEWKRQSTEIERSLTDSLLRGFEGGKGFAQNLVGTLRNMFNTLVLRPVIQAVISPIAGGVTGALGLTGTANAATGSSGLLGSLGGIGGLFGAGGAGGAFMAGAGWLTGATTLSGALGASGALIGSGSLAGSMSGLAMGTGALAPFVIGALALNSIFGKKRGGPKLGGSFSTTGERLFTPTGADEEAGALGQSALGSIAELASAFGGTAANVSLGIGFDSDPQGTAGNRISSFLRDAQGRSLLDNVIGRDVGRDDAALQAGLGDETARLVLAGLQASDLPAVVADYLSTIDARTITAAGLDSAIAQAKSLIPQPEKSLLDRALEDPGTYTAVSTEVRELVTVQTDHLAVAREQLQTGKEVVAALTAQLEQARTAMQMLIDQAGETASNTARLLDQVTRAGLAPSVTRA